MRLCSRETRIKKTPILSRSLMVAGKRQIDDLHQGEIIYVISEFNLRKRRLAWCPKRIFLHRKQGVPLTF